ncbi:hypothetical protein SteCoe_6911 [Stentor coeruleus]|uniref:Uncharacterized protein n=1 Tax=Stentor coeruleus TaxID=5963 RepID=A0A1R2CNS6_9CILI|nr:hypothetical protein SteCoe_6911 [Stentor coeruleus]
MSKSISCFQMFKCIKKTRSSSETKLQGPARMPTIREFLRSSIQTTAQKIVNPFIPSRISLSQSRTIKNTTPVTHRSTLAIRRGKSFIPLVSFDNSKEENKCLNRVSSPTLSVLERNNTNTSKNNTLLMSKDSFDAFFTNIDYGNKDNYKKSINPLEETQERKSIPMRVTNPFVTTDRQRPRIVAITPVKRRRNYNMRCQNSKFSLRPNLQMSRDNDYLCDANTNKMGKIKLYNDLEEVDLMK